MSPRTRIVVVDDYEPMRVLLRVAFEAQGDAEVVGEASECAEALAVVTRTRPDLVIVDLSVDQALPALVAIRRTSPECRIIVYSAQPAGAVDTAAIAAGADAYVEKGSPHDLLDAARGLLGPQAAPGEETAPSEEADNELAAIAAHGLLNALTVIRGAAVTLLNGFDSLPSATRDKLHSTLIQQMSAVVEGLEAIPGAVAHRCLLELATGFLACGSELPAASKEHRHHVLSIVAGGAGRAAAVLGDVVRGLPPDVRAQLDQLRRS